MTGKRDCNHTLVRAENGFMSAFLYRPSSHSIFATPPATLKFKRRHSCISIKGNSGQAIVLQSGASY